MDAREAHIVLNMMEKVGPVLVRSLKDHLGSVEAIFHADALALQGARGVGPELVRAIFEQREGLRAGAELEAAEQAGARILTPLDAEYPAALREIHDPPLALYVQGKLENRDRHALAIVGTRRPSHYGLEVAERLGGDLARAGYTVISGLAEGIDTAAHRGALRGGGRTIGVLGGALDCFFPPANTGLAREMAEKGAVLSEFAMGRSPDKTTFPIRNRIVSGMSLGVIVIEAAAASGALITARQALEQGRHVFAVPGRIDSSRATGCHDLIRAGATLVRGVDDILAEFEFLLPRGKAPAAAAPEHAGAVLSGEESAVVAALGDGDLQVDALIRVSGLKPGVMSSLLLGLEMKRVIRMLPGRTVALVRQGS